MWNYALDIPSRDLTRKECPRRVFTIAHGHGANSVMDGVFHCRQLPATLTRS